MANSPSLNWQLSGDVEAALPSHLRPWILYAGSFMERLKTHGINNASIRVLRQVWENPFFDEKDQLGVNSEVLVREVLIANETMEFMYARTVFSPDVLVEEQALNDLDTRSLGSVLFKEPDLQRNEFEIAKLVKSMQWYEKIKNDINITADTLWARRSLFYFRGKKLLLTEVFLPGMDRVCE